MFSTIAIVCLIIALILTLVCMCGNRMLSYNHVVQRSTPTHEPFTTPQPLDIGSIGRDTYIQNKTQDHVNAHGSLSWDITNGEGQSYLWGANPNEIENIKECAQRCHDRAATVNDGRICTAIRKQQTGDVQLCQMSDALSTNYVQNEQPYDVLVPDSYGWAIKPSATGSQSTLSLPLSTNGRCGPNHGESRCSGDACCSGYGWCGGKVGDDSAWCKLPSDGSGNVPNGIVNGMYDGVVG